MSSSSGGSSQPPPQRSAVAGSDADASPLIPLEYADAPNQRFYAVSLFALQQSYKIFQFLESYIIDASTSTPSPSRTSLLLKWAIYDVLTLWFVLPRLRIPRLSFIESRIRLALVAGILLVNWLCVGDWRFANALGLLTFFLPTSWRDYFNFDLAILEHRIRLTNLVNPAAHILGSVTIHILPHSTAKLILQETGTCYCVSVPPAVDDPRDPFPLFSQSRIATIPVLLNNTTPKYLQYSIQDFGEPFESRRTFNLTSKDLKQIATHKSQKRFARGALDYDSFDEELEEEEEFDFASGSGNTIGQRLIGYDGTYDSDSARGTSVDAPVFPGAVRENAFLRHIKLEKTQAIWSFNVNRPGIYRIERIIDKSDADVRIPSPKGENARILVVPCPSATFHHDEEEKRKLSQKKKSSKTATLQEGLVQDACQNDAVEDSLPINVDVFGFPPLKLTYSSALGRNKQEVHTIDGVAPDGAVLASQSQKSTSSSAKARKPALDGDASSSQQLVIGHEAPHGHVLKPQILSVPLVAPLNTVGLHQYRLEKVTDACGNSVDFAALRDRYGEGASPDYPTKAGKGASIVHSKSAGSSQAIGATLQLASTKRLSVHPRSRVSFYGCGTGAVGSASNQRTSGAGTAGQPIKLLKGGRANLSLRAGSIGQSAGQGKDIINDGPWTVKVSFEPDMPDIPDAASSGTVAQRKGWTREIRMQNEEDILQVDQPGKYRILSVSGTHCGGEVYEPSECSVYTPPQPTVDLSLEPITDSCAGEVGLKATFSLSGEPPYRVHYSVQHGSSRPVKKTKTVRLSREEIELRPDVTGEFTYQFLSIDDANYNGIEIGRTVKQTVHPLAGVSFANAGKGQKVWSCEGDEIQVPIELKGIAPWKVDYRIVGQKDVYHVEEINDTKHSLNIKIPPKIAKAGGQFTLSIERVVDGRGCSQPLAVDDLVVNVHRTQPTATLAVSKKVVIKEGESVQLPLRLTGEGVRHVLTRDPEVIADQYAFPQPWTVTYRHDNEEPIQTTIRANNGRIAISKPGRYELVSVKDAHCPGTILDATKSWEIEWITKPTLRLDPDSGKLVKNGSLIRPALCEGVDDTAGVVFSGQAPFFVTYDLIEDGLDGQKRRQTKDLQSIQRHAQFELSTATPGHKIYDFTGVSDSNYATLSKTGLVAADQSSKAGRVRLEQDILARPSVIFIDQDRKPVFCVKDALDSSHAHTPLLRLTGAAPFRVEVEISPDGSQVSQRYSDIFIKTNNWKLNIPQHVFAESGPYTVYLRKVVDSTGCERIIPRGAKGTLVRLEVADIASIAAVQPQQDHCVGDSIDFVLQGSSPWTVQYDFEGKKQKVTAKESRFSRVAEHPGNFKILSVAHHQDSCKSVVTDISKIIHPLPAAKVQSGNYYVENIREGDQAEIIFEFTGTPPFTFTYTKSAPLDPHHRKSQKPVVLETHTITNVMTHKYSIFTQSEGTWNVVSVQDKFCAYPPLGVRSDRKMIKN